MLTRSIRTAKVPGLGACVQTFLGWIDGDPSHEAAVLRALGASGQQDAREELGLGSLRDSFADTFFPGLSTIQTRARYFFFVQWCCELAARRSTEDGILTALHRHEVELISSLSHLGQGKGVIGIDSQDRLRRMPSDIYWSGLMRLGMRQAEGSPVHWARGVVSARETERQSPGREGEAAIESTFGFDPDRPRMPDNFPNLPSLDFGLTTDEARTLRRRLAGACADRDGRLHQHNLMTVFMTHRRALPRGMSLWDHPMVPALQSETRQLLQLARAFAEVMYGAGILYRRIVARLSLPEGGQLDRYEGYAAGLQDWANTLRPADVHLVLDHIDETGRLGFATRHTISPEALAFVKAWAALCRAGPDLPASQEAAELVSRREVALKGRAGTSRIRLVSARSRWRGGEAQRLDYRWGTAHQYLNDLAGVR